MNLPLRQQSTIEKIREYGCLSIEEMAQIFTITPQTVRRDINQLTKQGLLRRYHGGAVYDLNIESTVYTMRADQMRDEERRIAEAMTSLVPDSALLFINIGTTTETIARALLNHRNLKAITNNLHVAATLSTKEDFKVLVTGGTVRSDSDIVGQAAADFIQQFHVDSALVGISSVDEDGSLLDFDYREVHVFQAIIDNVQQVFLATDSSKSERDAVVRLDPTSLVNRVISDSPPPATIAHLMAQHKVHLGLI